MSRNRIRQEFAKHVAVTNQDEIEEVRTAQTPFFFVGFTSLLAEEQCFGAVLLDLLIDLCMCRLRAILKDGVLDRVTVLHVFWSWTNSGSVWSCVLTLSPPRLPRLPRLPLHPACCET